MIASHPAATMLIEYVAFLQVWYVDMKIYVYASINIRERGNAFDEVRDLVAEHHGRRVSEERFDDPDMMGGAARLLVYDVVVPMSITEQEMRMVS